MRDFSSGDINGDVNINDYSNQTHYKLLIHCDNEELLAEEIHRIKVLRKERRRKSKVMFKILSGCGLLLLFTGGWYLIKGQLDMVSALSGLGGVILTFATLSGADTPNAFEKRQIDALDEINTLLRERDVR
ncbi:DUF4149 domain-containing protein [Citrobacter freundii]|uniref:DUF4149 domain-containing protein n=2 Tax=Enterobacteriaceae TaxID=543 RepID=UPI0010C9E99D|nr:MULTISPECIES: DUF4149 domain-containing protein [Citrobacter]MBJ8796091.1 DUF4149 domain-containing protein [Citrobacter freundii]MDM2886487.1 DUF4149 domain-containing protein [Citrobacter sp. Cpo045]MDV1609783.1 DUF4149 domain-containing protein [Citrobacter portucalensis]MEB0543923.1 DUF4149 domain-containing protein [Citrobacter portucalensis]TKU48039.1 DUF4149 domain-containing protein [Citrobacter sp. wls757]